MPFRGLARTPRRIAQHLSEAAHACAFAAGALEAMARTGDGPSGPMQAAADASHASHRAALASAHMFGGGLDRDDVLAIARGLQTVAAGTEDAAWALARVEHQSPPWVALAGVIRDATREVAGAVDLLDGPAAERDAHIDRADDLFDEWRRLVRTARAQAVSSQAGPARALTDEMALRRLELTAVACRHAARAIRTVAIKHA